MSWGLFPVPRELLWSLVSLSHFLDCSLLSVSSLSVSLVVSLLPGAELSPPIFMPSAPRFSSHPHFRCVSPCPGPSELAGRVGMLHAPQTPALGGVWGRSHRREAGLGLGWDGMGSITLPFLLGPSDCGSLKRCQVPAREPRAAPPCPKLGEPGSSVGT